MQHTHICGGAPDASATIARLFISDDDKNIPPIVAKNTTQLGKSTRTNDQQLWLTLSIITSPR